MVRKKFSRYAPPPRQLHALILEKDEGAVVPALEFSRRLLETAQDIAARPGYRGGIEEAGCLMLGTQAYPVIRCTEKIMNDIRMAFGAHPDPRTGALAGGEIREAIHLTHDMKRAGTLTPPRRNSTPPPSKAGPRSARHH